MSKVELSSSLSTQTTNSKNKITSSVSKPPRSHKTSTTSSTHHHPPSSSMSHPQPSSSSSAAAVKAQPKPRSRFSLRRFFYTNPLLSPPFTRPQTKKKTRKSCDTRDSLVVVRGRGVLNNADNQSEGSWVTTAGDNYSTASSVQGAAGGSLGSNVSDGVRECSLCLDQVTGDQFPNLRNCPHLSCIVCLQQYVRIEIQEGRINLKCPQCSEILHPNDIEMLVGEDTQLLHLYESLMLRRVLAADPDTRWCPAPNCSFAVVATGCASCPKISCEREGCNASFCYHCKADWHPNQVIIS